MAHAVIRRALKGLTAPRSAARLLWDGTEAVWRLPGKPEGRYRCAGAEQLEALLARLASNSLTHTMEVVLAPPLARARTLPLPALPAEELRAVLERDAPRHFADIDGSVAITATPSGRSSGEQPTLVEAVPLDVLELLESAASSQAWRLRGVWTAWQAWIGASRAREEIRRGDAVVLIFVGSRVEAMSFRNGRLHALERLRRGDQALPLRSRADEAEEGELDLVAVAGAEERDIQHLTRALPDGRIARLSSDALALAIGPLPWNARIEHPERRKARRARARRRATVAALAGACALAAAVAVEFAAARSALTGARESRVAHASQLTAAQEARSAQQRAADAAAKMAALSGRRSKVELLLNVADQLPDDLHAVRLKAEGDSAVLTLAGDGGARALEALAAPASIGTVRWATSRSGAPSLGSTLVLRFAAARNGEDGSGF